MRFGRCNESSKAFRPSFRYWRGFESWRSVLKDLRDQKRYRTTKLYDEYVIVGKWGQVSLHSEGDLDVWITNIRKANKAELIWKARSTYDDGACFIRPETDLDQACQFIKARKKRQVTPAMRQKGRELAARFNPYVKKALLGTSLDTQSPPQATETSQNVETGGLAQ